MSSASAVPSDFQTWIRRTVTDLPIPRKLALIIGLFSVVIFGLLTLSYIGMEILSGSRAYVGGEALYSKAQKGAVHRLTRYALLHDEADYDEYLKDIRIPLGDHQARLELARPHLNFAAAAQGFVQGRNHPADVKILIWMARNLHRFYYMSKAIGLWTQADESIDDLQRVAGRLHGEIASGRPSSERVNGLLNEIQTIDARVTPLEDEFSYTLGEGARWLKGVLLSVMVLATGFFLTAALLAAFLISKHLCDEIDQLREGASRLAGGDYSFSLEIASKDEIGDLARSFQQMAVQRQQAERLKDEFFANISHELRTPLTLILSPLESLLAGDYGRMEERVIPTLQTMHNNTIRLLQLVNGLLDFSKLEAGKMPVVREPVRIADLAEMIYEDFQPILQARHLEARLKTDPPEVVVMMDRYLYERILFNLLANAAKFTPSGGSVRVDQAWAAGKLSLSVSDTGIGIPSQELQNIFQRFRQVEGSSTRRFEGTGLGLALVKEFASLLKGTVSVKSSPGKGSAFTVVCAAPLAENAVAFGADALRAPGAAPTRRYQVSFPLDRAGSSLSGESLPKVLIAEDNAEMASYIETLLRPSCRTKIVRDGNEALKEVQAWSPDLLLTDVMMPERDGLSLCREVKSKAATSDIPIVMLTALTHREALLEGWKAGANEYLFKPFHPQELLIRVQSLLEARRNQKQAADKIGHLNETLHRHALDLAAANKELEAFSYSVSHDLRAPLRAIDGFSRELLLNCEASLNERGKEDLQRIRAATQRMAHLIDDLLELSHLSRSELKREDVDVSALALEILKKLKEADPVHASVELAIAPGVNVQGDRRLLQVALENLLQNAWKFSQKNPRPKIEFGVLDPEGKKTLFVRDNGVGFNMAYAGKLFKPFQRLHDPQEFPGTGIGLALVHRIVHRHGGRIWAEAGENTGAAFYFTLS